MRVTELFLLALTLAAAGCGGSTTGGPQTDPGTLIKKACDNAVGLQCQNGPTLQQCSNSLNQELSQAKALGCLSEFDAVIECFADKITDCSQDPSVICSTQLHALDTCASNTGSGNCSMSTGTAPPGTPPGNQSCGISCSGWSAKCQTSTSSMLDCTCTAGPKAGATFTATSCQDLTSSLGAQYCQG